MVRTRLWLQLIVSILLMCVCCYSVKAETSFSVLTDVPSETIEARFEWDVGSAWSIGVLGKYFEDAEDSREDWAVGLFGKLAVDPNATMPVAAWLPELGDRLDLPETLTMSTYLIGKGELYTIEDDNNIDLVLSIGAGGEIGPAIIEWVYQIIEGGDTDNPALFSGSVLYVGLKPIKF